MATPHFARIAVLMLAPFLAWADAGEEDLFFKGTAGVNEGPLRFLPSLPEPSDKPHYHFRNQVVISDASLADGWVAVHQCHDHLDAVPSLQIVYAPDRIRKLHILSSQAVGRSWVEADSVQLQDLGRGASICVSAESRTLEMDEFGSGYVLRSGPYMRRFLDGYYPMRASLTIRLETDKVSFADLLPEAQPGFRVWQEGRVIGYDAQFEGMLRTELRFRRQP